MKSRYFIRTGLLIAILLFLGIGFSPVDGFADSYQSPVEVMSPDNDVGIDGTNVLQPTYVLDNNIADLPEVAIIELTTEAAKLSYSITAASGNFTWIRFNRHASRNNNSYDAGKMIAGLLEVSLFDNDIDTARRVDSENRTTQSNTEIVCSVTAPGEIQRE